MCRPVRCKQCGKTTWAGCGQHVATVRAVVPDDQWCPGHQNASQGLSQRLFGRSRRTD